MKTFAYVVRRFLAFGTDWYISSVLINLMTNAFSHFTTGAYYMHIALCFASIVVGFLYYVLVPCKVWKGQTFMMRAMSLKVVNVNGEDVNFLTLLLRFFIGCLIFEGAFYIPSVNIRSVLMIIFPSRFLEIIGIVINISSVIGVLCILLNWREFRLLHDVLFKTKVIDNASLPN